MRRRRWPRRRRRRRADSGGLQRRVTRYAQWATAAASALRCVERPQQPWQRSKQHVCALLLLQPANEAKERRGGVLLDPHT
eukprot:356457-Chlamydomonas_euryale.AAC.7